MCATVCVRRGGWGVKTLMYIAAMIIGQLRLGNLVVVFVALARSSVYNFSTDTVNAMFTI